MLSFAEKKVMMFRLDKLSQAVKKARQKANCQEVVDTNIGKVLADFILGK
ncbi:MAG: hypothetical protein ACI86H_002656 [bacterium]|jgi:hypothetical protein